MRLLNEMTPDERRWHEQEKRFCHRCRSFARVLVSQSTSLLTWNGEQKLPPRRFINAKIQVIEETWQCPDCMKAGDQAPGIGLTHDFEHVGQPQEIVDDTPKDLRLW